MIRIKSLTGQLMIFILDIRPKETRRPKGSANTKVEKKIRRVISVPCSISVSNT